MSTMTLPSPQATLEAYAEAMDLGEEARPQVIACVRGRLACFVLANDEPGIGPMLSALLTRIVREQGSPTWLTFAAESWAALDDGTDPAPGELSERAEAGDTRVAEVVILYGVAATGDHWEGMRRFHRSPLGVIWDEPLRVDVAAGGPVIDLMRRAVR